MVKTQKMSGLSFDEQKKLSGFETFVSGNCMRLGDIAHDSDEGWGTLFQNKINSAHKDGFNAYVLHKNGWHGYYESQTKDCGMGTCNCDKKAEQVAETRRMEAKRDAARDRINVATRYFKNDLYNDWNLFVFTKVANLNDEVKSFVGEVVAINWNGYDADSQTSLNGRCSCAPSMHSDLSMRKIDVEEAIKILSGEQKEGAAAPSSKQSDNCCICGERIVGEKRLYLNCNDVPNDPHCHSCNGGDGCMLAIGSGCAKKFKGKVKDEAHKHVYLPTNNSDTYKCACGKEAE